MPPQSRLKQCWREGRPAFGLWAMLGGGASIEALASLEPDWIVLDAEHGAFSYEDCFALLQAIGSSGATPLVRVPAPEQIPIKRVLDFGAMGVIIPQIRDAAEVARAVAWCRYPPGGTRGLGPTRPSGYYRKLGDYFATANDEIAVIAQIETREAAENLESILAVPGLDAVLIGPGDLAVALGHYPDIDGEPMQAEVARILAVCAAAGVPCGYYCLAGEDARRRADQGFRFISVNSDVSALLGTLASDLETARDR